MPLDLSVVIPSRDTRELTLACLDSLVAAGLGELEIIVVDDAGFDGTAEAVAAGYGAVKLLRLAQPAGFTRAANLGLAQATGELLLLLNSDTEVTRAGLTAVRERFAADARLGAAGGALRYPDGTPQWSGGREPTIGWLLALATGLPRALGRLPLYRRLRPPSTAHGASRVAWVTGAAMAIRRAAWRQVGPFDERFRFYAQDLDFCVRLRQAGWEVSVVAEFEVLHHQGATIGRAAAAPGGASPLAGAGRQHPELLWTDLLSWARKQRGERWARRAARALAAGTRLRLLARALAAPLVPRARRALFRAESAAFARALAALKAPGDARTA
ncbi:MAG TPA: glycosyltransferase family 2 protein [Thermoanaerobaculia bacterium]|nr:glycosyltransferase family 2 protein [Thermoanaerobaculia bacterium]